MSLIQEALKRQQDEMSRQEKGQSPAPGAPEPVATPVPTAKPVLAPRPKPPTPESMSAAAPTDEQIVITPLPATPGPPLNSPAPPVSMGSSPSLQRAGAQPATTQPPPPLPAERRTSRPSQGKPEKKGTAGVKTALTVLAVLVVLALLAVGIVFGVRYLGNRAGVAGNALLAELPSLVERAATEAELPQEATNATDGTLPPPPLAGAGTGASSEEAAEPTVVPKPPIEEQPVTNAPVAVASVAWPPLRLRAIVGKGNSGSAMLDDEVVEVGETIRGVRLIEIAKNGVWLEYKGEKRYLKTNAVLE